jgi:glycosyltransferase involved in cell wall biosynthesis
MGKGSLFPEKANGKSLIKNSPPATVLYAGHLPVFDATGSHPVYEHFHNAPPGYNFVFVGSGKFPALAVISRRLIELLLLDNRKRKIAAFTSGAWRRISTNVRKRSFGHVLRPIYHPSKPQPGQEISVTSLDAGRMIHLLSAARRLSSAARKNGASRTSIIKFIFTRDLVSQMRIPADVKLAFLPAFPYILGQVPWVIEIEDLGTLFMPFIAMGERNTGSLDIYKTSYYAVVKTMLESENCRGIITHVKSTANAIPLVFLSENLKQKTFYLPMGMSLHTEDSHENKRKTNTTRILFTTSWPQGPKGFYLRGGLDLLEAFSILSGKYQNLQLILRTALPHDLDQRYQDIIKKCPVEVIDRFLPSDELEALHDEADIYALPSSHLHVASVLLAMAHRLPIVVCDGWGMEDYVEDGKTGLVVRGRKGKCWWEDDTGWLRENVKPLFSTDTAVVDGLVNSLSSLIEAQALRESLGQAALQEVATKFTLENWNKGLAEVFDKALNR